jgi:hypothetical protein
VSLRRTYSIDPIIVNGIRIKDVVIDSHYEEKHSASIDDALILRLVGKLDGRFELPETKSGTHSYFATVIELDAKHYRLVWLLEDGAIYIGIINAYRDRRKD